MQLVCKSASSLFLMMVSLGLFRKTEGLVCRELPQHRRRRCHHVYHPGTEHLEVLSVFSRVAWTPSTLRLTLGSGSKLVLQH